MKQILRKLGIIAFWAAWPALWLYMRGTTRTRIFLMSGGKILVVRVWLSDGKWRLPGGGLHDGEDPAEGITRELREETGISVEIESLTLLADEPFKEYGFRFRNVYFSAELDTLPLTHNQKFEISDAKWMSPEELNPHNAGADVLIALRHRALLDKQ